MRTKSSIAAPENGKFNAPYTSFSRLTTYTNCSKQYYLKYVNGPTVIENFNEHFSKGKLVHACLEYYLDPDKQLDKRESIILGLKSWLEEEELIMDVNEILNFGLGFAELIYRSSARYKDKVGAIRTKDGGVPKDIYAYPPASFVQELKASGLVYLRTALDSQAACQHQHWEKISFGKVVSSSLYMVNYFELPAWYNRTVGVEMPISTGDNNNVLFSSGLAGRETFFRAFIDWVVESKDGQILILDHKTGKKKPSPQDVLNNPQLNIYAYLYEHVYGHWPEVIGIHHPWTGSIVMAKTDREIVTSTMNYFLEVQRSIEHGHYLKHHHSEFNSPCLKRDWTTNAIKEVCPFLQHCWPEYYETIEDDLMSIQTSELDAL